MPLLFFYPFAINLLLFKDSGPIAFTRILQCVSLYMIQLDLRHISDRVQFLYKCQMHLEDA